MFLGKIWCFEYKKIVLKFLETLLTLKIGISRSNFISSRSEDFRVFSYVIWWTEYEKNTEKNHWGILDLENLQSRSQGDSQKSSTPKRERQGTHKNKAPQRERQGDSQNQAPRNIRGKGTHKKSTQTWEPRGLTKIKHPNVRGKGTHKNKAPQRERQEDSQKSSTTMGSPFRHVHVVDPGSCWERMSEYFLTPPEMRQ